MERMGFHVMAASSDGPDYAAELGFLVWNIDANTLRRLGWEYNQNAVLAGEQSGKARLLWCGGSR
jgi:hypothetical protein